MEILFSLVAIVSYIGLMYVTAVLFRKKGVSLALNVTSFVMLAYTFTLYTLFSSFSISFSLELWWGFVILLLLTLSLPSGDGKPRICGLKNLPAVSILSISEEFLFRGVVLSLFPNVLFNAFLFSALHFLDYADSKIAHRIFSHAVAFSAGVVFSVATLRSNSVFPAILYHVVLNLLSLHFGCRVNDISST